MTEYTAHVQVPDAEIGAVLFSLAFSDPDTTIANMRSAGETWVSIGFHADSDDEATMLLSNIRYRVSKTEVAESEMPDGYDPSAVQCFETAPMIITQGRVIVHSEGVLG